MTLNLRLVFPAVGFLLLPVCAGSKPADQGGGGNGAGQAGSDNAAGTSGGGGEQSGSGGSDSNGGQTGQGGTAQGGSSGKGGGGQPGGGNGGNNQAGKGGSGGGNQAGSGQGGSVGQGGAAPAGMVPMFVAAGMGARTVTSCDDGRTWIANKFEENANVDHSLWTEKGLAYGNGTFVQLTGWGFESSARISSDGVNWKNVGLGLATLAGLSFGNGFFMIIEGNWCLRSNDGGNVWDPCPGTVGSQDILREAGGGGPFIAGGAPSTPYASFDSGATFKALTSCSGVSNFNNLGQTGGMAYGNNTAMIVDENGNTCRSTNGTTWTKGSIGGGCSGKFVFTGGKFWAPNGGSARVSTDGSAWSTVTFSPGGTSIHSLAAGASGTYVGITRARPSGTFYRSTDGTTWTRATGPSSTGEIRRVVFGYGKPSTECPQ